MPKKHIPVYNIDHFHSLGNDNDFYANTLADHLASHHFIHVPHKHDFFITVLFTHGHGTHEIDFLSYKVKPGSLFFLSPGQTHNWTLSENCDGYIFFHSEAFYNLNFTSKKIKDYPFFNSAYSKPVIELKSPVKARIGILFQELLKEYMADAPMKQSQLCNLTDMIYIELFRLYPPVSSNETISSGYLDKLRKLENMVDAQFRSLKLPRDYAELMNISEKHLNRICKECINKTTTELISDRVVLEARRLLITSRLTVSQVSEDLGYDDHAYFSRLFKKKCSETPAAFAKHYKKV